MIHLYQTYAFNMKVDTNFNTLRTPAIFGSIFCVHLKWLAYTLENFCVHQKVMRTPNFHIKEITPKVTKIINLVEHYSHYFMLK